jgi:hypothetical protein
MRSGIDLSAMCILETRMTSPDRCSQISSVSVPRGVGAALDG